MARTYETIILHCSATPPSMDIGAHVIDKWHRARGWAQCGYHYVIRRNGKIDRGRHISIQGAHAKGHNSYSIGVCYVGGVDENGKPEDNLTQQQRVAFVKLVGNLRRVFGTLNVIGHNDLPGVRKACPSFDTRVKFGEEFCNDEPAT